MKKGQIERKIINWILTVLVSFYLLQALENLIISLKDFPLKNIFLIIIPAPQDGIIELLQFIIYWLAFTYLKFKK